MMLSGRKRRYGKKVDGRLAVPSPDLYSCLVHVDFECCAILRGDSQALHCLDQDSVIHAFSRSGVLGQ
jgi:hypothetical protein